jgi:hypothetical protein
MAAWHGRSSAKKLRHACGAQRLVAASAAQRARRGQKQADCTLKQIAIHAMFPSKTRPTTASLAPTMYTADIIASTCGLRAVVPAQAGTQFCLRTEEIGFPPARE